MITTKTIVQAPIEQVWDFWTEPKHIMLWCFASDDWEVPVATNDLRNGGVFKTTMAAKDKSVSFDVEGTYSDVVKHARIAYTMTDGRNVIVVFKKTDDGTEIVQKFDPETENTEEIQQAGWQAILDNFKKYAETQANTQ